MIVRYYVTSGVLEVFVVVFEFVCIVMQWNHMGRYFSFVTLYAEQNKKRKELRII